MALADFRSQDDFSSLRLAELLDFSHGFSAVHQSGCGCSLKIAESTNKADETCHAANFIPDELQELLRIWELSYLKQQKATMTVGSVCMEPSTDSQFTESVYEPMRFMDATAPRPKRFHRTFWRSLTLRVVRLEEEKAHAKTAISSSGDASFDGSITSGATY
jgi:hypothetical protein